MKRTPAPLFLLAFAMLCVASGAARANHPVDVGDSTCATSYAPAEGVYGTFLAEDLWPDDGDYDFNDAVIAYNFQFLTDGSGNVQTLQVNLSALAAGATLHNGVYLHLPIPASTAFSAQIGDGTAASIRPGESEMVFELAGDLHTAFGDANSSYINTEPGLPGVPAASTVLTITFANPIALDQSLAPYDLFLARSDNYAWQIHLPQYAGTDQMDARLFDQGDDRSANGVHFINQQGLPFVIAVPDPIAWPQERVSIEQVYPDIIEFASSGGLTGNGWYQDGSTQSGSAFLHGSNGVVATPAPIGTDLVCSSAAPPLISYVPGSVTCNDGTPCELGAPIDSGGAITGFNTTCLVPSCDLFVNPDGSIGGALEPADGSGPFTVTVEAYNGAGVSDTTVTIYVGATHPLDPLRSTLHVDTPVVHRGQAGQVTVTSLDTTGAPVAGVVVFLHSDGFASADCTNSDANGESICTVWVGDGGPRVQVSSFSAQIYPPSGGDPVLLSTPDGMTFVFCVDPPANLIAWFRLDGDLGDAEGEATASSGDEAYYGSGYVGTNAFLSSGTDATVSGTAPLLNGATEATVEFWFAPLAYPDGVTPLFGLSDGVHGVGLQPAGNVTMLGSSVATDPINFGYWSHVAITFSNSQQLETLYVNGTAFGWAPFTGSAPFSGAFGAGFSFGGIYDSVIDEVSIYNRVLDPAELQSIVVAGPDGKCE